eukprot:m.476449 g.476449  ORF g.476449 m.476449 type:complete len:389 (-) comp40878_c0_seq1:3-1169(-)
MRPGLCLIMFLARTHPPTEPRTEHRCDANVGLRHPLTQCGPTPHIGCGTATSTPHSSAVHTVPLTANGQHREACVYVPEGVNIPRDGPIPMLIYLHGTNNTADSVLTSTALIDAANRTVIGGRAGFVLAAVQARRLLWPTEQPPMGAHCDTRWDWLHRNFSTGRRCPDCPLGNFSTNNDVATLDALINLYVNDGTVDPTRVYVGGWDAGGFFAELYGMARSRDVLSVQPSGTCVAAASVVGCGDPFTNITADDAEVFGAGCALDPYPTRTVPVQLTSFSCDAVTCCNADQPGCATVSPGFEVAEWVGTARERMGLAVRWDLLNASGGNADGCALTQSTCTQTEGDQLHKAFPVGHEVGMLQFLAGFTSDTGCWDRARFPARLFFTTLQ